MLLERGKKEKKNAVIHDAYLTPTYRAPIGSIKCYICSPRSWLSDTVK